MILFAGKIKSAILLMLASVFLLSCSDEEAKLEKLSMQIAELKKEITGMEREMLAMRSAEKQVYDEIVTKVPVLGSAANSAERAVILEKETKFYQEKDREIDGLLKAMSIRRDGMKLKFDQFRHTHPIE